MITATHKGKYYDVEYSIVNVSEIEGELRIDAEYYEPYYLEVEEKIDKLNHDFLYSLASNEYKTFNAKTCDSFYYIEISNVNLTTGDYEIENLPCSFAPSRAKKIVEKHDILISTVRPNRNAVVFIFEVKQKPLVASTGFCKLKVIDDKISPLYLFILFKTKYYRDFLVRKTTATMYPAVSEKDIMDLNVPTPSDTFQKLIEKFVLKAYEERQKAEKLYKQAEETLLEELGLKNWKPKTKKIKIGGREFEEEENISIRMLSDVLKADRMDAEYWELKYDVLIEYLKSNFEVKPLKAFLLDFQKGIEVGSDNYQEEGKPFIRVSNLSIHGFAERNQKYIDEELYQTLKDTYEPKAGDFLLTKDATPGIAYVVKEPMRGIIASGILKLRINEEEIDKEYLALCINSMVGRLQIEKDGGGSIITHWKPNQIKNLQIPILPLKIQQKIALLIQQSFKARENSKKLLEIAKRAVEIYIEKDETEGQKYINEQLQKMRSET